jgi:hypothetical protein
MTVKAELVAVAPTANAKTLASAKALDFVSLQNLVKQHVDELKVVLAQLIAMHPSGGGDAANLAALQAVLAELV